MSTDKELPRTAANHPNEPQMPSRMRLTMDEMRVLQECNRESFYYRSLPFAVTAIAATQFAVNRGLLKSHPRWGSAFKLVGAGFVGWFVGKISYRPTCEEKLLQLQNSPLADMIRKKKGRCTPEIFKGSSPGGETTEFADDVPAYSVDDDYVSSSRSLNLDTDKNIQYFGLDDSDRSTDEYDIQSEDKPPKFSTTYDDLRRKNREDYELRQSKMYSPSAPSSVPPLISSSPKDWRNEDRTPINRPSSNQPESSTGFQNIYGDRWEK